MFVPEHFLHDPTAQIPCDDLECPTLHQVQDILKPALDKGDKEVDQSECTQLQDRPVVDGVIDNLPLEFERCR